MKPKGAFAPAILGVSDDRGCIIVAMAAQIITDRTPKGSGFMQIAVEPYIKVYALSFN